MAGKWVQKNPAVVMLNQAGALLANVGIQPSLSERSLLAAARRATGLHHFGDDDFIEPMRRLIADMEAEAQLTTFGRLFMRQRLVDALAVRLQVDDILGRHPEILEQDINDIWFITALPRTGTTMLQRLLAMDPGVRPLLTWEAIYPVPPRRPGARDRRVQKVRLLEKLLRKLYPVFFAIHPLEHDAPEKDLIIMQQAFLSQAAEGAMHVPNYARWLETADKVSAYRHLEKVLKILQWQKPEKRWLLKNPFHMEDLDTLMQVFPQARVIQTHRDLARVVPSVCSLSAHSRGLVSDAVDGGQVGRHWQGKYQRMVNRCMDARQRLGAGQFVDILYDDLMKDPLVQIESIYRQFHVELTEDARMKMQEHARHNKKDKYGRHEYTLEEFGLSKDNINRDFATYVNQYHIVSE